MDPVTPGVREAWLPPGGLPYCGPLFVFLVATTCESWYPSTWYPLAYTVKTIVVSAMLLAFRKPLSDIRPSRHLVLPAVCVGMLTCAVWIGLERWLPYPHLGSRVGFDPFKSIADPRLRYAFISVRLVGLAVVVPVMEELFWRSFLLRYLTRDQFGSVPFDGFSWQAFAIVAVLFASAHPEWLPAVLTACVYGLLVRRTASIFGAVVAHATTNAALGAYVLVAADWVFW